MPRQPRRAQPDDFRDEAAAMETVELVWEINAYREMSERDPDGARRTPETAAAIAAKLQAMEDEINERRRRFEQEQARDAAGGSPPPPGDEGA